MAKRKKRVNTGLVALITAMFMLLTVAIVSVITFTQTNRDPAKIAEMAATFEKAGDREQAIQRYIKAYQVNRESKYVIEAARVMLDMGRWQDSFGLLQQAHRADPSDLVLVQTLLERFWEISKYINPWNEIKEYSAKVLGVWDRDREDINYTAAFEALDKLDTLPISEELRGLAVISLANALNPETTGLPVTNDRQLELKDKALEIALASNPYDPRVVSEQIKRIYDYKSLKDLGVRDRLEHLRKAQAEALTVLEKARAAQPQPELDVLEASVLSEEPIYSLDNGAYHELRRTEEALELLRNSLEQFPDDSTVKTSFALTVVRYITDNAAADTPIHPDESKRLINEAQGIIEQALEKDPGFYQGVDVLANLAAIDTDPNADPAQDEIRRLRDAVAIYDNYREEGVTAETLRAAFGDIYRMRMLFNGFYRALALRQKFDPDSAEQKDVLAALGRFNQALQNSYPEQIEAEWTAATFARLSDDDNEAIRKYTAAAAHTDRLDGRRLQLIFDANQQLARLFYARQQSGEAMRYADTAISMSARRGFKLSDDIPAMKFTIMVQNNQAQEALDQVEVLLRDDPNNAPLNRVRAQALLALNRPEEARESIDKAGEGFAELAKVRLAIVEQNFEQAIDLLRQRLASNIKDRQAIDLLVQAMTAADQQDALLTFLNQISEQSDDGNFQRWLESRKLFATIRDPNERIDRLVDLINEQSDPESRAADLFNTYRQARRMKKAQAALNELEKYRPDDIAVLDQQFRFAIQDQDLKRAESYVARLSELNADQAGGARYRSELALAQNKVDTALSELLIAENKLPPDANLKAQLARTYLMSKPRRVNDALAALEEALRLNPRHPSALRLMFLVRAETDLSEDDPEYESLLARAWAANPRDETLRPFVEQLNERKDPAKAITQREQKYQQNPEDGDNLLRLVALYARPEIGQEQKAAQMLIQAEKLFSGADLTNPEASANAWRYYRTVADFFGSRRLGGPPQEILDHLVENAPAESRSDAELIRAQYYFRLNDQEKTLAGYHAALDATESISDTELREQKRFNIQIAMVRFNLAIGQLDEGLTLGDDVVKQLGDGDAQQARSQAMQLAMIEPLIPVRPDDARRRLDAYRAKYPDDARGHTLFASLLIRQQQLDEAKDILTLILRDNPRNAWALDQRGGIYLEFNKFDEARRDLLAAKAEAPWGLNLRPRYRLARLYELNDQPKLAQSEYLAIIDAQPQNLQAARMLLDFYRRTNQNQEAEDMLARMAARYPTEWFWSNQLGNLRASRKDFSGALSPLEKAAALTNWSSEKAVTDWGLTAVNANRAREVLAKMKEVGGNVSPVARYAVLAAAYNNLNQPEQCQENVILAINEIMDLGARQLGNVIKMLAAMHISPEKLLAAIEHELARTDLTEAQRQTLSLMQIDPYIILDNPDKARELIEALRPQLDPKSENYATLLTSEAQMLEYLTDATLEQKRPIYEALLELEPNNYKALNNLAFALADSGHAAEAQKYVERLRALDVRNASVLDTIGTVFMKNGKLNEAEAQFRSAIREEPRSLEAHLHLGEVLSQQNAKGDAVAQLKHTIEVAQTLSKKAMSDLGISEEARAQTIDKARKMLDELQ